MFNMTKYIAGWDGGGTKTICEVYDLITKERIRFTAGPLNPNGTASGQSKASALELLRQMGELQGGLEACQMLCIGVAGISNPDTANQLEEILKESGYNGKVYFTGDQQTALYGALGGMGGAVLIAGTGSICYGQNENGQEARTGGWGSLMDDEGGGYAIGRDILAAVVRAEDGRGAKTYFERPVFEQLKVLNINEMIKAIYSPNVGKKEIASLAPILNKALEQNDEAAIKICEKSANELALLVSPVVERLHLENERLALAGSILVKCLPVRELLIAKLEKIYPGLKCISPMYDAAYGAVLLAERALNSQV